MNANTGTYKMQSLLDGELDILANEPNAPTAEPNKESEPTNTNGANGQVKRNKARKPKPYEVLRNSAAVVADRKAEKKATKSSRKVDPLSAVAAKKKTKIAASKPAGKLSKASLKVATRKAAVK